MPLPSSEHSEAILDDVRRELRATVLTPLADTALAPKAPGVYCLYYVGADSPLYSGLTEDVPIYVGQTAGRLSGRLGAHARSVQQGGLPLADFAYRAVATKQSWATVYEAELIEHFDPLWNTELTGFGNNAPGAGREGQVRPLWDTLHPGRPWADRLAPHYPLWLPRHLVERWCARHGYISRSIRL